MGKHGLSILIHCTHGFNRSGYMIISYWMRMCNGILTQPLTKWINLFATSRPPGINKPMYLKKLHYQYDRNKKNNGKTNYLLAWKSKLSSFSTKMTIKKFEDKQLSLNKKKSTNIKHYMALFEKISASEEILNEH